MHHSATHALWCRHLTWSCKQQPSVQVVSGHYSMHQACSVRRLFDSPSLLSIVFPNGLTTGQIARLLIFDIGRLELSSHVRQSFKNTFANAQAAGIRSCSQKLVRKAVRTCPSVHTHSPLSCCACIFRPLAQSFQSCPQPEAIVEDSHNSTQPEMISTCLIPSMIAGHCQGQE